MPPTLELREEPYDGPSAQALIEAVQQEYVNRYGGPDETPVSAAEFSAPNGRFLVGYVEGVPAATGALRRIASDTVEIKRMFVAADYRGNGFARQILARLEDLARELGHPGSCWRRGRGSRRRSSSTAAAATNPSTASATTRVRVGSAS